MKVPFLVLLSFVGPVVASDRESTLKALMDAQGLEVTYDQVLCRQVVGYLRKTLHN
jgi:hypothetical protein